MVSLPVVLGLALALAWEWPHAAPTIDRFVIGATLARQGTFTTHAVPVSPPGACATAPAATSETHCALWPTCPPAGEVMVFWVWAEKNGLPSPPSNPVACHFVVPCVCTAITLPPSPPPVIGGTLA
jgi:hypothetical protein